MLPFFLKKGNNCKLCDSLLYITPRKRRGLAKSDFMAKERDFEFDWRSKLEEDDIRLD
jgi:hypothetical protein